MSTTLNEIRDQISRAGKTLARSGIYVHLTKLGIKPIGARQRPQRYPADTAERLLTHLGLRDMASDGDGILSLEEIKRRARRGRRAVK